jgi:hypothetical protein
MKANELPPPAQMILLLGGFRISQALYAAAVLGVADQLLAGPAQAEVLAERAGHTRRRCAGCCGRGPAWACSPSPSPASLP